MDKIKLKSVDSNDVNKVLEWLNEYHLESFKLKGRYYPHEVISWLINDFANSIQEVE